MPKKSGTPTKDELRAVMRELGARGGKKRGKTMTPEQRSASARAAAEARWAKKGTGDERSV